MKLPIELVPDTCWYTNVRSHVTAATWGRLRGLVVAASRGRCEICGRQGTGHPVECHEVWGYDDDRGIQRLEALQALCPDCHLVKHFGRAIAAGRTRYALAWFAHVNTLTPEQALAHAQTAFSLHQQRSQRSWALDLTLLTTRYGLALAADGRERV